MTYISFIAIAIINGGMSIYLACKAAADLSTANWGLATVHIILAATNLIVFTAVLAAMVATWLKHRG